MLAIILAGGEGVRLRPVTENIPKVLVPVQGRALLEHVIDILKTAGVDEVILSTGYLAEVVEKHFAHREVGVSIRFLKETPPRGTAGPLLMLKEFGQIPEQDFFMVNGDNLFALDLEAMMDFHRGHGGPATIALTEVDDPSSFGVARMAGDRITEFVEKPPRELAPSRLINSGYYLLSPSIFQYVRPRPFAMMEHDIMPMLARLGKLFGHRGSGQWFDTGTPERYAQVQREWKGKTKK